MQYVFSIEAELRRARLQWGRREAVRRRPLYTCPGKQLFSMHGGALGREGERKRERERERERERGVEDHSFFVSRDRHALKDATLYTRMQISFALDRHLFRISKFFANHDVLCSLL
jgi:hypothetical protein